MMQAVRRCVSTLLVNGDALTPDFPGPRLHSMTLKGLTDHFCLKRYLDMVFLPLLQIFPLLPALGGTNPAAEYSDCARRSLAIKPRKGAGEARAPGITSAQPERTWQLLLRLVLLGHSPASCASCTANNVLPNRSRPVFSSAVPQPHTGGSA